MLEQILHILKSLPDELIVILLGAMPISEVRGAIPVALAKNFPLAKAVGLAVLGNIIPVVPVLLFLDPVQKWLGTRFPIFKRFFDWLFTRTRKHSDAVEKYEAIGLAIFVGVPLPMTGAWSGCVAAFLFGIRFWRSFWAITAGILIAAAIVTLVCLGFINIGGIAGRLLLAH
ncbi:MAG: small multi-drug export protein [Candidatus Schekmanbacteria bacterium]|nr:small multi-drug export protein [Candidatus Schekmanbacteria bacterium]